MKLKCTRGKISCDGVLAKKGDTFEVEDEAGERIIASGYAAIVDARGADSVTKLVQDSIASGIDESTEDVVGSTRFDGDTTDDSASNPDTSWTVADIKVWLDGNGIEYQNGATKTELLSLANQGE